MAKNNFTFIFSSSLTRDLQTRVRKACSKRDAYLKFRLDRTPCKKLYLLVSPPFLAPFDPFFFMESSF